jgi:hypothetical protein
MTEQNYDYGMIGLGTMGRNLVGQLSKWVAARQPGAGPT